MSLGIEVNEVVSVLLADGWHEVHDSSFYLDSYEYIESHPDDDPARKMVYLNGGQEPLVPATGFTFREAGGTWMFGPLTSIVAVRAKS